ARAGPAKATYSKCDLFYCSTPAASADAVPALGQVAAEEIDPGEFAVHHVPDVPLDRRPPGPLGEDDLGGRHRLVDRFADLAHHPDVDFPNPLDLLKPLLRYLV